MNIQHKLEIIRMYSITTLVLGGVIFKLKMYFYIPCPFQPILLLHFEPTETSQPKKKLKKSPAKNSPQLAGQANLAILPGAPLHGR